MIGLGCSITLKNKSWKSKWNLQVQGLCEFGKVLASDFPPKLLLVLLKYDYPVRCKSINFSRKRNHFHRANHHTKMSFTIITLAPRGPATTGFSLLTQERALYNCQIKDTFSCTWQIIVWDASKFHLRGHRRVKKYIKLVKRQRV